MYEINLEIYKIEQKTCGGISVKIFHFVRRVWKYSSSKKEHQSIGNRQRHSNYCLLFGEHILFMITFKFFCKGKKIKYLT